MEYTKPGFVEKREKQLINEYCIKHELIIHEFTKHGFIAYNIIGKVYESYRIDNELGIIEEGAI